MSLYFHSALQWTFYMLLLYMREVWRKVMPLLCTELSTHFYFICTGVWCKVMPLFSQCFAVLGHSTTLLPGCVSPVQWDSTRTGRGKTIVNHAPPLPYQPPPTNQGPRESPVVKVPTHLSLSLYLSLSLSLSLSLAPHTKTHLLTNWCNQLHIRACHHFHLKFVCINSIPTCL